MKTLVFSDSHLGQKFDERKFKQLTRIIDKVDRVVINGDFWDAYLCSFEKFITSKWSQLFPLLKQKFAVYLYGNHDLEKWCDERVNLFSVIQGDYYQLNSGSRLIHIEHGHRLAPVYSHVSRIIPKHRRIVGQPILWKDKVGLKLLGRRYFRLGNTQNNKIIKKKSDLLAQDIVLVCGHTHVSVHNQEYSYINTGFINFGYCQYLEVDGETFTLRSEKY